MCGFPFSATNKLVFHGPFYSSEAVAVKKERQDKEFDELVQAVTRPLSCSFIPSFLL